MRSLGHWRTAVQNSEIALGLDIGQALLRHDGGERATREVTPPCRGNDVGQSNYEVDVKL